jgi:hypothetical protein
MQFRGQTHLIRVPLASPDVTREEIQAASRTAYFHRFQVRLPEIRAVLVNLVTSVIGRRRAFPLSALLDPGPRGDRGRRRRHRRAAGPCRRALVGREGLCARGLPSVRRSPARPVIQQIDATTVIEPGAVATVDAIGNLRVRHEHGPGIPPFRPHPHPPLSRGEGDYDRPLVFRPAAPGATDSVGTRRPGPPPCASARGGYGWGHFFRSTAR